MGQTDGNVKLYRQLPNLAEEITVVKGDDWVWTLYYREPNGAMTDITGWVVEFVIRTEPDAITDTHKETVIDHYDPRHGSTIVLVHKDVTETITRGVYYYQFSHVDGAGLRSSTAWGILNVI